MDINENERNNADPILNQQSNRKKCHGNRRDQRLRRKLRAQKMKSQQIKKCLKKRIQIKERRNQIQPNVGNINTTGTTTATTTSNLKKRKRDQLSQPEPRSNQTIPKSISSLSIAPSASKKIKKKKNKQLIIHIPLVKMNDGQINKNYRRPMYLKRSSSILFAMLKQKFNYFWKDKNERQFICNRLNLFDQHYCLQVDLQLQQSYVELSVKEHVWPDELYAMTKTKDFVLCEQYLHTYIANLQQQSHECQMQLMKQAESYSMTQFSLDQIDQGLKEFVDSQRKYLSNRNKKELIKSKANIDHRKLIQSLSNSDSTRQIQIESIDQLMEIRKKQADVWKDLLIFEMRIICQFLPRECDEFEHFIAPISYELVNNDQKIIELRNQRNKIIQEAKRQWLNLTLHAYEIQIEEYEQQYQNESKHIESDLPVSDSIKEYLIEQTNQLKQSVLEKVKSSRMNLLQNRQHSSSSKELIGVSPQPYLDLSSNPFDQHEWKYLSLGSSCIRLNQSAIRPRKQQEIAMKKEYDSVFKNVQSHLMQPPHQIPPFNSIFKKYSTRLLDQFNHSYLTPVSYKDQLVAYEQANIAQLIRKKIEQQQLILRVVDNGNNFYIGSFKQFEEKVQKYLMDTNAFIQLSANPFHDILNRVTQLLRTLASKGLIFQWQMKQMLPDRKISELSHLYFNPKVHKIGIPVRPIQNTIRSPTAKISNFLDQLIRPIFDEKCQTTSIITGSHLIKEIQKYIQKGLFKSSTLFCTFDIHNLYTMLPQEESLDILIEFLHIHGFTKVKNIDLKTIRTLASIVLKENVFVYGKHIYKQTTGGAMGSSFTLTLANIFMWKWQKELVRRQDMTSEFYGRYIDDIFMTWNRSEKELRELLNEANAWHPNIKLDYQIGQCLPFLDVLFNNENGLLLTSTYHKPSAEPYVVPFISDHPRHVFGNIVQGALTRAIRYSSTNKTFDHERRYIKLMLLYNGYPSSFIENQFRKFFNNYTSLSSFQSYITDEQTFLLVRKQLLEQPTTRQSQIAAIIESSHEQLDEEGHPIDTTKTSTVTTAKKKITNDKLIVDYTHEKRFESMKRDMHQIYDDVFRNTPVENVEMIVGTRDRRDARNDLIRKRPNRALLQDKPRKKRTKKSKPIPMDQI